MRSSTLCMRETYEGPSIFVPKTRWMWTTASCSKKQRTALKGWHPRNGLTPLTSWAVSALRRMGEVPERS